jgi:hypothetical protein
MTNKAIIGDDQNNFELVQQALENYNYFGKRLGSVKENLIDAICCEFRFGLDYVRECISHIQAEKEAAKTAKKSTKRVKAKTLNLPISAGVMSHSEQARKVLNGKKFLVTSCQNNTDIHTDFLASLENYASSINAELLIFPFIYNLNGFQNGEGNDDIFYDKSVRPYLQTESLWLNDSCKVAAMNFNILPTVKNPLAGLKETIGSAEILIIPHATIAHENVAVLGAQQGKIVPAMYSTGCVSMRNYIQQAAGHKAEGRHTFGALIVEFNDNGIPWVRQIETDNTGEFFDLLTHVTPKGASFSCVDAVKVINYGDIHAEKIDIKQASFLWKEGGLLDFLKPKFQLYHDLFDFETLNHHNRENHLHLAKNAFKRATVEGDLEKVLSVLYGSKRDFCQGVIVRSNHDDALDRWVNCPKYNPKTDTFNAPLYYTMQTYVLSELEKGSSAPDLLRFGLEYADKLGELDTNLIYLKTTDSFKIDGTELAEHGHSGTNGSRGSPKQFSFSKMTTGHSHTSSIFGGCYTSGVTGKLKMGYNETGASSWTHSHVLQYKNGFRTIIHVKDNGAGELSAFA